MNLALLHVQDLDLPPLNLSEQGADVGRAVQDATVRRNRGCFSLLMGRLARTKTSPAKKSSRPVAHLLQHNALITTQSFGMPLVQRLRGCHRHQPARPKQQFVGRFGKRNQKALFLPCAAAT